MEQFLDQTTSMIKPASPTLALQSTPPKRAFPKVRAAVPQGALPHYIRRQPRFEDTFGTSGDDTITTMDAEGDDIPNQAPTHRIPLQKMGVNRLHIPVTILDPFGSSRTVQLQCAVDAYASVAPERRGVHVSRMGNILAHLTANVYPSLQDYAVDLCKQISVVQKSHMAEVDVSGTISYIEAVRGVKDKASVEHIKLRAGAQLTNGDMRLAMGIGFNHITACPCVQQTYKHSFANTHHELLKAIIQEEIPFITHSQRCASLLSIENIHGILPLKDVLECVDAVIVRCQNTLPREFELLTVYRAHKTPQFLEDTLRDMLHAIYCLIGSDFPESTIRIQASSMESIHDFDIAGEITYSVQELHALRALSQSVAPLC